jgi:hypothetical protein
MVDNMGAIALYRGFYFDGRVNAKDHRRDNTLKNAFNQCCCQWETKVCFETGDNMINVWQ